MSSSGVIGYEKAMNVLLALAIHFLKHIVLPEHGATSSGDKLLHNYPCDNRKREQEEKKNYAPKGKETATRNKQKYTRAITF